jgi:hypothetical protein
MERQRDGETDLINRCESAKERYKKMKEVGNIKRKKEKKERLKT